MSASAYEDFIDLVDICLACCYAPGSHTAENLAGMLSDVFEGLDLEPVVVGKRLTFMGKRVVASRVRGWPAARQPESSTETYLGRPEGSPPDRAAGRPAAGRV